MELNEMLFKEDIQKPDIVTALYYNKDKANIIVSINILYDYDPTMEHQDDWSKLTKIQACYSPKEVYDFLDEHKELTEYSSSLDLAKNQWTLDVVCIPDLINLDRPITAKDWFIKTNDVEESIKRAQNLKIFSGNSVEIMAFSPNLILYYNCNALRGLGVIRPIQIDLNRLKNDIYYLPEKDDLTNNDEYYAQFKKLKLDSQERKDLFKSKFRKKD